MAKFIIHAGLHKTGSTYIQKNLNAGRAALKRLSIVYLGRNDMVKLGIWKHIQTGKNLGESSENLRKYISSKELGCMHLNPNETSYLFSEERIFGSLREGYHSDRMQNCKFATQINPGFYADASIRAKRFIEIIKASTAYPIESIEFIAYKRSVNSFAKSVYSQLIKERIKVKEENSESFLYATDWSNYENLEINVSEELLKHGATLNMLKYENYLSLTKPSLILETMLGSCLKSKVTRTLMSTLDNTYLSRGDINPSLNELGTKIAAFSRDAFNSQEEWINFRKILEKHYSKQNMNVKREASKLSLEKRIIEQLKKFSGLH